MNGLQTLFYSISITLKNEKTLLKAIKLWPQNFLERLESGQIFKWNISFFFQIRKVLVSGDGGATPQLH